MSVGRSVVVVMAFIVPFAATWGQSILSVPPDKRALAHLEIEATRQLRIAEFEVQHGACANRFAVTDCENQVKFLRRTLLADLRHQESALDYTLRRGRAQAQELLRANRTNEGAGQAFYPGPEVIPQATEPLQEPSAGKERTTPKALRAQTPKPLHSHQRPTQLAALEVNRQAYAQKQSEAQLRRHERDKRLHEADPIVRKLPKTPRTSGVRF